MTREQWRDWLEGIGIVAIIASLIFVGIQLQQDKEIAVSQIYAEINNIEIERTRLILDNDDLWIRGLKGEELDERETLRFEALAEAWADLSNGRYIRVGRITFGSQDDVEWEIANFVESYPGLKQWWLNRADFRKRAGLGIGPLVVGVNQILDDFENGRRDHVPVETYIPN
jgi:hypothetical protein